MLFIQFQQIKSIADRTDRAKMLFHSFKAAMDSILTSLACFMIEINVPFAISG